MKIDLTDDSLKSLISEAILQSLDGEKRDTLIRGALAYLLAPVERVGGGYGKPTSHLERAFQESIVSVARRACDSYLSENDEVRSAVEKLVAEGMHKVIAENREQTVDKIAEAIRKGITGDRY